MQIIKIVLDICLFKLLDFPISISQRFVSMHGPRVISVQIALIKCNAVYLDNMTQTFSK